MAQKFEIIYDEDACANIREEFEGTWDELQSYIKELRGYGCFNIDAAALPDGNDY